jgi:hypothetical protein
MAPYRPNTRFVSSPHFVGRWSTRTGVAGWDFHRFGDGAYMGWTGGNIADARRHLDECERQLAASSGDYGLGYMQGRGAS